MKQLEIKCKRPNCKSMFEIKFGKLFCSRKCKEKYRQHSTLNGRIARNKRKTRFNKRHPLMALARTLAKRFVEREECAIRGCGELGSRHHPDYRKPLEVVFLCQEHHQEHHNRSRRNFKRLNQ